MNTLPKRIVPSILAIAMWGIIAGCGDGERPEKAATPDGAPAAPTVTATSAMAGPQADVGIFGMRFQGQQPLAALFLTSSTQDGNVYREAWAYPTAAPVSLTIDTTYNLTLMTIDRFTYPNPFDDAMYVNFRKRANATFDFGEMSPSETKVKAVRSRQLDATHLGDALESEGVFRKGLYSLTCTNHVDGGWQAEQVAWVLRTDGAAEHWCVHKAKFQRPGKNHPVTDWKVAGVAAPAGVTDGTSLQLWVFDSKGYGTTLTEVFDHAIYK